MCPQPHLPTIDPDEATTLFEPATPAEGHWVGAPCAHVHDGTTYLAVRWRSPEDRGHELAIYERRSRRDFERVATISASALGVESVERPALVTDPGSGAVRLYLPVDHGENDWTIQKLADVADPSALDPASARDVLRPAPGTTDGVTVKDPCVGTIDGRYYMFYAGHDGDSEQAHLATSSDGEAWVRAERNPVLPRQHWHDHHTRISCVVPRNDGWLVFYGGSGREDYGNTWNLRTGVARTGDLETIEDGSPDGPWLAASTADRRTGVSEFATCRYLDILERGEEWEVFFEVARRDGAFELRHAIVDAPG